jgi:hypothetical protein
MTGWLSELEGEVLVGIEGAGSFGAGLCEYLQGETAADAAGQSCLSAEPRSTAGILSLSGAIAQLGERLLCKQSSGSGVAPDSSVFIRCPGRRPTARMWLDWAQFRGFGQRNLGRCPTTPSHRGHPSALLPLSGFGSTGENPLSELNAVAAEPDVGALDQPWERFA